MTTVLEYKLADLKAHPELLLSLFSEQDSTWIMRRDGDSMVIRSAKDYSDKAQQLLHSAKLAYQTKAALGYSRDAAIEDFQDAQSSISKQM